MNALCTSFLRQQKRMLYQLVSVWMQPVYQRLNRESVKVLVGLLCVTPVLGIVVAVYIWIAADYHFTGRLALIAGSGFLLDIILLLMFWYIVLVGTIALQYSPANAGLVPNLRRNLQWALALPIVILPMVLEIGHYFQGDASTGFAWLLGVFFMLIFASTIRSQWMVFIFVFASQLPMLLKGRDYSLERWQNLNTPVFLIPLGLLLIVIVLHWTFGQGDTLFKSRAQLNTRQEALSGKAQWQASGLQNLLAMPYMFQLRQLLKRPASGAHLITYALGPRVGWGNMFLQVLGMIIVITAIMMYFWFIDTDTSNNNNQLNYLLSPIIGCLFLPFGYIVQMSGSLYQTRTEQALLSLTASAPAAALQTKILMQFLLRQFFLIWLTVFVIAVLTCELIKPSHFIRELIYIACFSTLFFSVCIVRNFANLSSAKDNNLLIGFLAVGIIFCLSASIDFFVPGLLYWILFGMILVPGFVILTWRWKKIQKLKVQFPVGRAV